MKPGVEPEVVFEVAQRIGVGRELRPESGVGQFCVEVGPRLPVEAALARHPIAENLRAPVHFTAAQAALGQPVGRLLQMRRRGERALVGVAAGAELAAEVLRLRPGQRGQWPGLIPRRHPAHGVERRDTIDEPRLHARSFEQDPRVARAGPLRRDQQAAGTLEVLAVGCHRATFHEEHRVAGVLLQEPAIGGIRLRRSLRPDIGPCQTQFQWGVCGIRRQRLLKKRDAIREFAGIDERAAELFVGAACSLGDLALVEFPLGGLFLLIGRPTQAELPLDVPRGPFHGCGLLRLGGCPPQEVAALLVVEAVQKEKPCAVLGDA
jgi:hypothetical protein